jgi:hypothetical protein
VARSLLWAGWQRQALSTLHLRWASSSTSQPIPSFSFTSENHFTFKNSQKIQACSKFSKVLFHLLVQSLSPLALFFFAILLVLIGGRSRHFLCVATIRVRMDPTTHSEVMDPDGG